MAKNQPTGTFDPETGTFIPAKKKSGCLWFVLIPVILIFVIVAAFGGKTDPGPESEKPETEAAETTPTEPGAADAVTPEPTAPEPETKAPETDPPPTPEEIRADYIASCAAPTYEEIMRRPDEYKKKPVTASGKVIQIVEETHLFTGTTINIRLEDGNGDVWLLIYNKSDVETPNGNVLEGDRLTIYGDCSGTTSYKTVLGKQITVPSVVVKYMTEAAP